MCSTTNCTRSNKAPLHKGDEVIYRESFNVPGSVAAVESPERRSVDDDESEKQGGIATDELMD